MLSGKSNLYVTNPRILKILKGSNLAKSNLSLNYVIQINVIFIFSVYFKKYTLSFFLKVSP